MELAKFTRAEPDPALFRAPQGYVLKKATARELADKLQ